MKHTLNQNSTKNTCLHKSLYIHRIQLKQEKYEKWEAIFRPLQRAPVVMNSHREVVELHVHPVVVIYQVLQLFHIALMHRKRTQTGKTRAAHR